MCREPLRRLAAVLLAGAGSLLAGDAAGLLREFIRAEGSHPNLPYVAQAGHDGLPLPVRPVAGAVVIPIRPADPADAVGDDEAISGALRQARTILDAPGATSAVVIALAPGRWRLTRPVFIDRSHLHLRGSGSAATILHFERPLSKAVVTTHLTTEQWSFRGGLVWIENGVIPEGLPLNREVIRIAGEAPAGARTLAIAPADEARARALIGRPLFLKTTGGQGWLAQVYGHAPTAPRFVREQWGYLRRDGTARFEEAQVMLAVDAGRITLAKPIRVAIAQGATAMLGARQGDIVDASISALGIRFPEYERQPHLKDHGYNGVFVRCGVGVRVEDVAIDQAENGIMVERSAHTTLRRTAFTGGKMHHAISLRVVSTDTLVEDFAITASVVHGISVQDLSAGSVFSRGRMATGTFDSHRGMPFDTVRTEIVIAPWGSAGGAAGPLVGRRMVNWNVEIRWPKDAWGGDPKSKRKLARESIITGSQWSVMGALVGIRGAEPQPDSLPWELPPGDKGTIVADWGQVPEPVNLYEAQRAWWRARDAGR